MMNNRAIRYDVSEQYNRMELILTRIKNAISPPQLVTAVFVVLICIGTLLLSLPQSSATGVSIGLLDALFTSVSAVCVNGLIVLDTGSSFSTMGQIIIMLLIQIGGLGFMTLGVMVAILLGRRIGLKQRLILQQTTQSTTVQGLVRLSIHMVLISFVLEAAAALVLTLRWQEEMGWGSAFYYGLFHSVSAFNNAGFSLWSDSLSSHIGDPVVNLTIVMLFLIGGLGFIVVVEVLRKRSWKKLSLHSKVVLSGTGILTAAGFGVIFLLESWNPDTFGPLSLGERILAAFFQGVAPRSAGFNSIDIGSMLAASQFFMIVLMFIGAASGGTGGGIKINTFVVLILATLNTFRGSGQIHAFHRKINQETVMRALAVVVSSISAVLLITMLLTMSEGLHDDNFLEILFEATSAFSTTGMSMGLTGDLTSPGKIIISITMFIGRLGPLTLAYALSQKKKTSKFSYPEDNVLIG
ncbi:MAG: Na+-transporting synthase [Paenibacillaceae bacterium]|jgi:trk system potassium uptake protein TrkH|nr:Na+-transporting synthase [Paenibacillaceae bacterium]